MVFVDFREAFDTVRRTGIWQLLRQNECPEKFTTVIEALHTAMIANVGVRGEVSESFSVNNRVMRELLFADCDALVAHSAEEIHKIVDVISDASSKKFGL